jgi:hypothetical protein
LEELDKILVKQSSSQPASDRRDSLLLVTNTGKLVVIDWDVGGPREDGGLTFKPGLRQRTVFDIDYRSGGTPNSLGKFIKVSEEYSLKVFVALDIVLNGLQLVLGSICFNCTFYPRKISMEIGNHSSLMESAIFSVPRFAIIGVI